MNTDEHRCQSRFDLCLSVLIGGANPVFGGAAHLAIEETFMHSNATWQRALIINKPAEKPCDYAFVLKITELRLK